MGKLLRVSERCQTAGEISQRWFTEVAVRVIGEQRMIDGAALQARKNIPGLIQFPCGLGILDRKQQGCEAESDLLGRSDRILIRQHGNGDVVVGKNVVL